LPRKIFFILCTTAVVARVERRPRATIGPEKLQFQRQTAWIALLYAADGLG
jgi:hypothetical protein